MASLKDFLSGMFGGGGQPYTGPSYQTSHMRSGPSRHISGDSVAGQFTPEQMWSYNAYKNDGGHHTPGGWYAMSNKGQYHVGGNNLRLNADGTRAYGPLRVPKGYEGPGTLTSNVIGGGTTTGGGGGSNKAANKKVVNALMGRGGNPRGNGR